MQNKEACFVGLSLAACLQTNSRFWGPIGLGELGLLTFIIFSNIKLLINSEIGFNKSTLFPYFLPSYICLCLLPSTALTALTANWKYVHNGDGWRDLLAYCLSGLFIFSLATRKVNYKSIVISFSFLFFISLIYQYMLGGESAWYGSRFTGGAKNPNQLALYVSCCLVLISATFDKSFFRSLLIFSVIFAGLLTKSDAILASFILVGLSFILIILIPRQYFFLIFPLLSLFILLSCFLISSGLLPFLRDQWILADQGGSRITLWTNGIHAWLDNPWSILFGNGAGAFSGFNGPFEGKESHNTVIDSLAVGGLFGLFTVYFFPIQEIISAYSNRSRVIFATMTGLVAFSCFHFVARHPIFWFSILVVAERLAFINSINRDTRIEKKVFPYPAH